MYYLELIKVQLKHKVLHLLLLMLPLELVVIQFPDQARMKLNLQLISAIPRVLKKLIKYFNGTAISIFFVLLLSEDFPVIFNLN